MSLIDDALKKTQSALTRREKPAVKPTSSILQSKMDMPHSTVDPRLQSTFTHREKSPFAWEEKKEIIIEFFGSRAFLLCIAIIVLLALSALLYKDFKRMIIELREPKRAVLTQTTLTPINTIKLDGTLATGKEHAALINDKLYYAGQTINGYHIQSITYNKIILLDPATKKTYVLTPVFHP